MRQRLFPVICCYAYDVGKEPQVFCRFALAQAKLSLLRLTCLASC